MRIIENLLSRLSSWFEYLVLAVVVGAAVYLWSKRSWRWLAILTTIGLGFLCLIWLPSRYPPQTFLRPDLPAPFRNYFWTWVLVLVLGAIFSAVYLGRMLAGLRPAAPVEAEPTDLAGRFPELDAAWEDIQIRLGQAQVQLGDQHVVLVLAPDEDTAAALIRSAGMPLFAHAPDVPAPIHAYATAEGVLLSCAGASGLSVAADGEATARLEYLCRLLLAHQPDCPVVRGVAVVFPVDWAAQPDAVKVAAAVRDDLRTIQRVLRVHCPVFTLISRMETVPGFTEFVDRMPAAMRQNRCGFAVPSTQSFSGDLINRGMVWMSGWFHSWVLNLVAEDLLDHPGNNRLVDLDFEVRRLRKRLRNVMEAAFSTLRGTEPVLFRGCYFVASGESASEQAFSAGLLQGPRGRIPADHRMTEWTAEAEAEDRRYRRIALGVGLAGGLLCLLAWVYILTLTSLGWIGLVALAIAWIVAIVRLGRW